MTTSQVISVYLRLIHPPSPLLDKSLVSLEEVTSHGNVRVCD